jgi:hypothetical protein
VEPHFQQDAIAGLHFLGDGNKPIESLPPTILNSHFLVVPAIGTASSH